MAFHDHDPLAAAPPEPGRAGDRSPTVLVADPNALLREIYSTFLRFHGYRVVEAADADQTAQRVRDEQPGAIVLDLELPGLHGLDSVRAFQGEPDSAAIPVIVLSAEGGFVRRIGAQRAGGRAYLEKPFDPRELLAALHRVLSPMQAAPLPG